MNSDLERAFKNIVKHVPDYRPMLRALHVDHGEAIVSDSHQMLLVKNFAPADLTFDLRLDTFEFVDFADGYPDTSKLWPTHYDSKFEVPCGRLRPLLRLIKVLGSDDPVRLTLNESGLTLSHTNKSDGIQFSYTMPVIDYECVVGVPADIYCNPELLIDAFTFFTGKQFLWKRATFEFGTALSPFTISGEGYAGDVKYLIAPTKPRKDLNNEKSIA